MRVVYRAAMVCVVLLLSTLILAAPRAAADWCTSSMMTFYPQSGSAGSSVNIAFTFENQYGATLQISDFSASYSWGGISDFGPSVVAAYGSVTGTATEQLPATAGSESLYATVTGQANTDYYPITCYFGPMPFTVNTVAPLSATAWANPTATDAGVIVAFTCTGSGGSSPYTYSWSFGDGAGATGGYASHAYSSAGTKTATCTTTDSVSTRASAQVVVTVDPAPKETITSAFRAAAPGFEIPLDASASGGTGSFVYGWTFGDGTYGSGASVTHAYSRPGNYTATVVATDTYGGFASTSVNITVAPLVAKALASTSSITAGTPVTFAASATGGAGTPYTFLWDFGDGSSGTGATASHAYSNPGTYTARLTAKDGLGATNVTTLTNITIWSASPLGSSGGFLIVGIGIAGAVAAVGVAVLLMRRRGKSAKPPAKNPAPLARPPPPKP